MIRMSKSELEPPVLYYSHLTLWEPSQNFYFWFRGVLPIGLFFVSGSICYTYYNISLSGVLPKTKKKIKVLRELPECPVGVIYKDHSIMSRSLPLYNFSLFGCTSRSTIPLLWECSCKTGTVPSFFKTGVLPEALYHFCGSTPTKVV